MFQTFKNLNRDKKFRLFISILTVSISAFLQSFVIQVFVRPCNMLSAGFTGLSILISDICGLYNINFPISVGILALNIPVAIFCYKHISKRFTLLSCICFGLNSLFLSIFKFHPLFEDTMLNVLFGGFLNGFATSLALRTGGSAGGTDFIAQYISNKLNKSIWDYVFAFNCIMLLIFGYLFGWVFAGYSILFQFLSTKTISTFYQRYSQITLEITTQDPKKVYMAFYNSCHHGMTIFEGIGGYSHKKMYLCKAVVSAYEVADIIHNVRAVEPNVVVNTYSTLQFYGNYRQVPIE